MSRVPSSSTLPIASLVSCPPRAPLSLIYASHSRWPLPPRQSADSAKPRRISISVLDSSFNPPHRAHAALAESSPTTSTDARLLAFTVSNADKQLDPNDLYHRLEMIRAFAVDLHHHGGGGNNSEASKNWDNVAVAVIDAATFTNKSRILKEEITNLVREEHGEPEVEPEFVFPVGWDTVVRIFAPRYYPPPGPDLSTSMETFLDSNRSSLVCARRGNAPGGGQEEREFLSRPQVERWVRNGKLKMVDLDRSVREISSTAIRNAVEAGEWDRVEDMVPFPSVIEVMKKEGLYLTEKAK